jgi:[ribosomal protein S5]-alanine N-acetyltransferase
MSRPEEAPASVRKPRMTKVAASERIETERMILRAPRRDDADAIFARYASDPDVTRYMGFIRHASLQATHEFLDRSERDWKRDGAGVFLAESRDGATLLGSTGLHLETPYRAMTGYLFAKDAWGKGYATEALNAMSRLARDLGIVRLYALTHPENVPSWRVLEKCGFTREGLLRRCFVFPNLDPKPADVYCYARILPEADA